MTAYGVINPRSVEGRPVGEPVVGKPYYAEILYIDHNDSGGWRLHGVSENIPVTVDHFIRGQGYDAKVICTVAFTPTKPGSLTITTVPQVIDNQDPSPLVFATSVFGVQEVTPGETQVKASFWNLPVCTLNVAHSFQIGKIVTPESGGTWTLSDLGNLPITATLTTTGTNDAIGVLNVTLTEAATYWFEVTLTATGYLPLVHRFEFVASAQTGAIMVYWEAASDGSIRRLIDTGAQTFCIGSVMAPESGATMALYEKARLPSDAALSHQGNVWLLTGTFPNAGTFPFGVRVTAPNLPKVEKSLKVVVSTSDEILVTPANLRPAVVNTEYQSSLGTVAYPSGCDWSLQSRGDLPQNATVGSDGTLTATFATAGQYSTGIARVSKQGYTSVDVAIRIAAAAGGTTPYQIQVQWEERIASPIVGVAYTQKMGTKVGELPVYYIFVFEDRGNLPQGITIGATTGIMSGTFSEKGAYYCTIRCEKSQWSEGAYCYPTSKTFEFVVVTEAEAHPPPPPPVFGTRETQDKTAYLIEHEATDDGFGALTPTQNDVGTVNYTDGILFFPVENLFPAKVWSDAKTNGTGEWKSSSLKDTYANGSNIEVTYVNELFEADVAEEVLPPAVVTINLTPYSTDAVIPNSVRFTIGSTTYQDNEGVIVMNPDGNGVGTEVGTIDYGSGIVTLHSWTAGSKAFTLTSLAVQRGLFTETAFRFRTALSPLRPTAFQIAVTALDGELLTGSANLNGDITGNCLEGTLDAEFGTVSIRFGEMVADSSLTNAEKAEEWYDAGDVVNGQIWKPRKVIPSTCRYNAVAVTSLPLSADLLGMDPVRLPSDGRVPGIVRGDMVVVQHSTTHSVESPQAGGTVDTELTGVARVRVYDVHGDAVHPSRYSLAQDTGIVTWSNPLDLEGYTGPYTVEATIEDAALVTDADISGRIRLNRVLTHDFPEGSLVSSAMVFGDLFAQASTPFSQQAWTSVWADSRIGSPILAQYNSLQYPVELNNASSWRERWLLLFTSQTSFRVIGETLGDITDALGGAGYHDISHDLAPINPLTGTPYFTLHWEGWSGGWVSGNCLRFNTQPPANFPVWIAMTVHPSAHTTGQDRFRLLLRGGIDA